MPERNAVGPLTIIAIFAGIIEASALAALPFLGEQSQTLYTWFLVCFPFFLTALFFLTLNFNAKSFYQPETCEGDASTPDMPAIKSTDPVTVMLSGPDAQKLLEQQLLQAVAQTPETERRWCFCNVEMRQCIHLSIAPMPGTWAHVH
ncbi:hypothetical protein [Pseudomonas sp. NPDC089401]|uniref:hypothetical protein n=1 Tax=Pseudomonas sp. NPDC089401 TaxID=3364462 RepID=UPI003820C46C